MARTATVAYVLLLLQSYVFAQYFVVTPKDTTVCAGTPATFYCKSQVGAVYFTINGSSIFTNRNITSSSTQENGVASSVITVPGIIDNDYLMIMCNVVGANVNSNVSVLRVQGPPSQATNLAYNASSASLSWTPPSDALNTSLLSYQVVVRSLTSGVTLTNNITMETTLPLPTLGNCGSPYIIEVQTMCGTLIGTLSQLNITQDITVSRIRTTHTDANSIMVSWDMIPGPPLNYSVVITRDNGTVVNMFVTNAAALTIPVSTLSCTQYSIFVSAICPMKINSLALTSSPLNILTGTPPDILSLTVTNVTSVTVKWEVPLSSPLIAFAVQVTEPGGSTVYSNVTMETSLTILSASFSHYHLSVTPLCGSVRGAPFSINITTVQKTTTPSSTVMTTTAASKQIITVAAGAGAAAIFVLVIGVALSIAVVLLHKILLHKRNTGGAASANQEAVRILLNVQKLFLPPNNKQKCEEFKFKVTERQQLSQHNFYIETEIKSTLPSDVCETTDGRTFSISSRDDQNPYADIFEIRRKSTSVPSEPHYSTPRIHYDVPKNISTL